MFPNIFQMRHNRLNFFCCLSAKCPLPNKQEVKSTSGESVNKVISAFSQVITGASVAVWMLASKMNRR